VIASHSSNPDILITVSFSFKSAWLRGDGVVTNDERVLTALPFQTSNYPSPIF